MPSSYVPPDVYVTQKRRSVVGTAKTPVMPVIVVGLARQIETRAVASDVYDPRAELTVDLPNLTAGGIVDSTSVEVFFEASNGTKSLGLFQLAAADFSTVEDEDGNITGLSFASGLTLDRSILSSRNNNQPNNTTDDDSGSGTPDGITFTDSTVDFLAKGASADGNSYIVISAPSSMAGVYRILELIPTNNKVRQIIVEKVTDIGGGDYQPDLVAALTLLQNPPAPLTTTVYGAPATHEGKVFDGATDQVTPTPTTGAGVVSSPALTNVSNVATAAWGATEIAALVGASTVLHLPGRQLAAIGNDAVKFGPVDSTTGNPDTTKRALAFWRNFVSTVTLGDWVRVGYAATISENLGTITALSRTNKTITVTSPPAAFVPGRPFTVAIAGSADYDGTYSVVNVSGSILTLGSAILGVSNVAGGTATLQATSAHTRDFKVTAIDTTNWDVTFTAANGTVSLPVYTHNNSSPVEINSVQVFKTFRGRADNVNGAGDYLVYDANGVTQRIEVLSASPTKVTVVTAFSSFTSTTLGTATTPNITTGGPNAVVNGFTGLTVSALIGKYITIAGAATAANNGTFPITANSTTTVTYTNAGAVIEAAGSAVAFDAPNVAVTMRRGVPFRNSTASYDLRQQIDANYTANVLVNYVAERRDLPLDGLIELASRADVETALGPIHPKNPLALGADMVVRSGLADGTRTFYALATAGDTLEGFLAALDTLVTADVYNVVPLTQDKTIIEAFQAHVDAQSQPRNKHERVLWANTVLPTYDSILPTAGNTAPTGTFLTTTTFQSASSDLGLVKVGDEVKILVNPDSVTEAVEISRRVLSIDLGTGIITFLSAVPSTYTSTVRSFRVDTFPFTKDEQAEAWRDEAKSFANFRVKIVRPDQIEISYTDKTLIPQRDVTVTVPGFYLAAAYAGLAGALTVDAPLTNVPIPGVNRLIHANDYFTPPQLDTIAEGGNDIVVQDSRVSVPYSRQQLSTDMTSTITREWSITKIVDFTAKFFRNSLKPYIGNKNITREYLTQLRGTSEAILRKLKELNILLAGSQILTLKQNPDEPDSIILEVSLDVPYPGNRIYVTLYV